VRDLLKGPNKTKVNITNITISHLNVLVTLDVLPYFAVHCSKSEQVSNNF